MTLGEIEPSETITKKVQDTNQPADLPRSDYTIQVKQVSFTVSEYLKGSGDDTITITQPSKDDDLDPNGTDAKRTSRTWLPGDAKTTTSGTGKTAGTPMTATADNCPSDPVKAKTELRESTPTLKMI